MGQRVHIANKDNVLIDESHPLPVMITDAEINIESVDLDVRNLSAAQDTVNVAMAGVEVDETHPLAIMVPGRVGIEGGNAEDVIVSLDSEQISLAAGQSIEVEPGTNPIAITGAVIAPISVIIANGQSISGEIDVAGAISLGIEMPAAFTGTVLTFLGSSVTGGTFKPIMSMGYEVSTPCAANQIVSLGEILPHLSMCRFIKIRSGTSASPTAEAAERQLYVIAK